ncbi:hypothetical protein [Neptuniibacter sp. 1_MG-2023]|uniref:hypothetical protein n=1 Tax=Neptuniibacter sp. 1_MG-2023 TaxID=3062662 RepID=UPI0026E37E9A|nr:hypothetical protein [Neptuniibacter sp. 1_MG-2023]MDO6594963.1 hypothetical protein [Neptuniibacter sp. 1_MG-2023]
MISENNSQQEKVVESNPSLESEINSARINALELKLETLSIITESLWNLLEDSELDPRSDLKKEMAKVISDRAERDTITVHCPACDSQEKANSGYCRHCGEKLSYSGEISPFDY